MLNSNPLTVMAIRKTSAERRYKINCYERSGYTMTRHCGRRHRLGRESTRRDVQLRRIVTSVTQLRTTHITQEPAGMVWMIRVRVYVRISESAIATTGL
jgi:hypothetical protein